MSTSRVVGIGWLVLALVAPCVSAAGTKDAKPPQKAPSEKSPAKAAPANASECLLVVDAQASGNSSRIEKALDEPTEFEFIEAPLTDVIEFLKTRHQIEIQLDNKALEESGVAIDTQITRHVKGVTLRSALRLVLRDLELTYVIRDEVLLITPVSNAETILTTRLYPVGDLLAAASDEIPKPNPAEGLIAVISKTVMPTTWYEVGGPGSISYLPVAQSLVIAQTFETHEEICGLLAAIRKVRSTTGAAAAGAQAAEGNPTKMFVVTYFLKRGAAATQATKQPGKDDKAAVPAAAKSNLADDLARAVPEVIEPASWKNNGGQGTVESIGIGVVVRQTRHVQVQVMRFLESVGLSPRAEGDRPDQFNEMGGGGSMF